MHITQFGIYLGDDGNRLCPYFRYVSNGTMRLGCRYLCNILSFLHFGYITIRGIATLDVDLIPCLVFLKDASVIFHNGYVVYISKYVCFLFLTFFSSC